MRRRQDEAIMSENPPEKPSESSAPDQLPQIDFSTFVLSLSHSAFVYLGDVPTSAGGKGERNLVMARQTIDILALLAEKTKGNLTGEEERLLEQVVFELRMRFVEASKEPR
jgi:hypothetical protein